jgi:transglutaminase-like putative cysteine protease
MNILETSLNPATSMRVSISGNVLTILKLPENYLFKKILIVIKNSRGDDIMKQYVTWSGRNTISLEKLSDGTYSMNIYFLKGNLYWAFFAHHRPMFVKERNNSWFISSPFAIYNSIQTHSWPTNPSFLKRQLASNKQYQSNEREIRRCAHNIAHNHLFPYTKMMAVHDFIALNIAYDKDALKAEQYLHNDNSALSTLRLGRGVCQGYTNLSIALLRSLGIPAMEVPCYALGLGSEGGWENPQNKTQNTANHVFTAVFVNNRWSIMDITWDSDLEYENGELREKTGSGIMHNYFDMTATMLSLTHKIIL